MILIVDFGSQTAHLIGRRLRDLGVTIEYVNPEEAFESVKRLKPSGIILSGGPAFVHEKGSPTVNKKIFGLGIPVLGICYGWQLMAYLLGGSLRATKKEFGPEKITFSKNTFKLSKTTCTVIMSHGMTVTKLPPGFSIIGSTKNVRHAAVVNAKAKLFGILFHPEADHTEQGTAVLKYFVSNVCSEQLHPLSLDPLPIIKDIKEKVGDKQVICAVSGGVDSTVAAALIGKAIGKNLLPVYIESGLMKLKTLEHVRFIFRTLIPSHLIV